MLTALKIGKSIHSTHFQKLTFYPLTVFALWNVQKNTLPAHDTPNAECDVGMLWILGRVTSELFLDDTN